MARRGDLLTGAAIGAGLAVLVPVVFSAMLPVVRPLVRSAVKNGIMLYEKGRETLEEFNEAVDDMRAEVEQEMQDAREVIDEEFTPSEDLQKKQAELG